MINCEETDQTIDPPATAVGFRYANPVVEVSEENPSYELEAATTTPLDMDLTLNFEVNNNFEQENTSDDADYTTNGSITIPAGQLTGSTTIDFNYEELNLGETKQIVFSIVDTLSIPYTINNTKMTTVVEYAPECVFNLVTLDFVFDDYASETYWQLYRTDGGSATLIRETAVGDYDGETEAQEIFCIESGEYALAVYDDYGDGFCCDYGEGSFSVTLPDGSVVQGDANFGANTTLEFTVE